MKPEKLSNIKKELAGRSVQELTDLCLRLAKYKKENKELLNYLLYDAADPLEYAEQVKSFLENDFKTMQRHYYYSTKSLRKILRLLNRHIKFTGSKEVEAELLIWFCHNFLTYADTRSSHKPLQTLFARQMDKIEGLFAKMHEDLAFDYRQEYERLQGEARQKIKGYGRK